MLAWQQFVSSLEKEYGKEIVAKWMPKCVRFDALNIYLEPADSFQASWFEEHVRPRVKTFTNEQGRPVKVHLAMQPKQVVAPQPPPFQILPDAVDPEMLLSNFITSEENSVIHKLFLEPIPFNPVLIYGEKSSGKTHLLMGLANLLQKQGKRVFFVNAESFTDHVVQAIRKGEMQKFRSIYRDIDVLIVDDIHILAKKFATQEEFFHTFNTLHTSGRLVVLSSAIAPSKMTDIEERLISRFEWGISLELLPSPKEKILEKNEKLPQEIRHFLLSRFPNPILAAEALKLRSRNLPLTLPIAEKLLSDLLAVQPTFESILKEVAGHYGIKTTDILSKSQLREVAIPRQVAMFKIRALLKWPYQKIGAAFDRDHSTVMSSIKQIADKIPTELK